MTTPTVTIADFTTEDFKEGTGVFDVMMRSVKEHVANEYRNDRIKGTEYSTVYLGGLQAVMTNALQFVMSKDKLTAELALLDVQQQIAEVEKSKVAAEKLLVDAQVAKIGVELELAALEKVKIAKETLQIEAATVQSQKQALQIVEQTKLLTAQELKVDADKLLVDRQELNGVKEGDVLDAQACKLKAEFDLIMEQVPKVGAEKALLDQKQTTERAQTQDVANDSSVVGRQMQLYRAQADGFKRDAEQKAAKIMVDSWNVRRSTNEDTIASDATYQGAKGNRLSDSNIGDVIKVLKEGINAPTD